VEKTPKNQLSSLLGPFGSYKENKSVVSTAPIFYYFQNGKSN